MRTLDWVTNAGTYDTFIGQYDLWNVPALDAVGELEWWPLTFSRSSPSVQELGVPEITNRMMALRTQGYLHWRITTQLNGGAALPDVFSQNWTCQLAARITRFPQENDGVTVGAIAGYDLTNQQSANDQYVYHREHVICNHASNDWLGTGGARAQTHGTWRIDVKYKRMLEDLQCMAFFVQFTQANPNPPWQDVAGRVFLQYRMRLRTLVQAYT